MKGARASLAGKAALDKAFQLAETRQGGVGPVHSQQGSCWEVSGHTAPFRGSDCKLPCLGNSATDMLRGEYERRQYNPSRESGHRQRLSAALDASKSLGSKENRGCDRRLSMLGRHNDEGAYEGI